MHLYFITKGDKKWVDDFMNQLIGKWLPFKYRKTIDEPFQDVNVQLSVRPIQLWEVGFPKEHKDLVCSTILGKNGGLITGNDGTKETTHPFFNKMLKTISKMLGLKPIGKYDETKIMPIHKEHVSIVGLGIKEDYTMPTGVEGI